MSSKKSIYLLSASDRFNYGDLLFPIVAKKELELLGDYEFFNVATVKSNLVEHGALPTLPYTCILNSNVAAKDATLVVAGGQVLNADWSRLISFISSFYYSIYEKYSGRRLEKLAKFVFGRNAVSFPFIPSGDHILKNFKLVFHAVGGDVPRDTRFRHEISRSFKAANYFSVRENTTRVAVKNRFNTNTTLVPDSVAVISDHYPKSELVKHRSAPYVCVQLGFHKSHGKLPIVLRQLKAIHQKHNLEIALLSIGNCPGHDDELAIEWLVNNADFPISVLPSNSVEDITSSIAHANLFVGTSLHGVIVSMSYGNPFIGVNKRIKKVDAYSKTWAPEFLKGSVDFNQIANTANRILTQFENYDDIVSKHKMLVKDSFTKIHNVAQNNERFSE